MRGLSERIYKLRASGLSYREIMREAHCSPQTVKNYLRKNNYSAIERCKFTKELKKIVESAPNKECRKMLETTIHKIERANYKHYELLYPVMLKLIADGCAMWFEFQDELSLSERHIRCILREMVAQGILIATQEGSRSPMRYSTRD